MGIGIKTALNRQVSRLAPRYWYNYQLRREFAKSDYFGLHPPRSVTGRFLRALLTLPAKDPGPWLFAGRMNSVLKHAHEVEDTLHRLFQLGLYPHLGREKNWDAFRAFSFILTHGTKDSAVLDMGSSTYGRILPWLHLYGLRDLHGCDLSFDSAFKLGGIHYTSQNLEQTGYSAARFDFVTCLSVIEHGVDLDSYFREARRILKPGGYLLTSTDYWCAPLSIDVMFDELYGCPVKVFSTEDIPLLLNAAALHGFSPIEEIDCSCRDRLVHWERFDLRFTFLFFVLQRDV